MAVINANTMRAAVLFVRNNLKSIGLGAGAYGVLFALQTLAMAYAGAYSPGAAPISLIMMTLGFVGFIIIIAGWGRLALAQPGQVFRFSFDEGRLLWVSFLIAALLAIILLTAGLLLSFMLAAITFTNLDAGVEPASEFFDIFATFDGPDWVVASLLIAAYGVFSLWLFLRLLISYPASLDQGQIKVLSAWPLSGQKRTFTLFIHFAAMALPGLVLLWALSTLLANTIGASPATPLMASENGQLSANPVLYALAAWVYGFAQMALIYAPLTAILCDFYNTWKDKTPLFTTKTETAA